MSFRNMFKSEPEKDHYRAPTVAKSIVVDKESADGYLEEFQTILDTINKIRNQRMEIAESYFPKALFTGAAESGKTFEKWLKDSNTQYAVLARKHGQYAFANKYKTAHSFVEALKTVKRLGGTTEIPVSVLSDINIFNEEFIEKSHGRFVKDIEAAVNAGTEKLPESDIIMKNIRARKGIHP